MAFNRTLQHFTSSQELATIWASGQSYIVNQLVLNNNLIYRCLIANTSSLSFSTDLGAGKWVEVSASASGTKNYISNSNFEQNTTTGWSLFNTTLTSKIPTGSITAGAASITSFAVDSTTPIAGTYDLRVASSGALTAGQGFISDAFTIDREDQAKPLAFSFAYEAVSGTMDFSGTSNNTFAVYIYDVSGSAWIQPAGVYNLTQGSGIGIASGTFQTTATGTQYRIAVLCVTATSGAVEMRFDDFQLGPQRTVYGSPITDWQDYTPTVTGMGTGSSVSSAKYRRVGDTIEVEARIQASVAGSGASGITLSLPANIDTSKLSNILTAYITFGVANFFNNSTTSYSDQWTVVYDSSSTSQVRVVKGGTGTLLTGADMNLNSRVVYNFKFPAAGFSSSVQMSNDTDTRVVAARVSRSGVNQGSININNSAKIIEFFSTSGTYQYDTHSAFNAPAYTYIVPISGYYSVKSNLSFVNTNVLNNRYFAYIDRSGNAALRGPEVTPGAGSNFACGVNGTIYCTAGQSLSVYIYGVGNNSATPITLDGANEVSYFIVERLSGPATIAASETVAMNRCLTSGQSIPSGVDSVPVSLLTNTVDTHGIWVNGTGYNSVTGTWTTKPRAVIPISGKYLVQFALGIPVATGITGIIFAEVRLFRNGVVLDAYAGSRLWFNNTSGVVQDFISAGSGQFNCLAGDELILQVFQGTSPAVNRTLNTEQRHGFFAITKAGY
jgi:hypothetical protein